MVKRYIIRIVKSILYFSIILGIMLGIVVLLSSGDASRNDYSRLFKDQGLLHMLYFVAGISVFYPMLAYLSKKVYLNRPFEEDRKFIEEIITSTGYQLVKEDGKKLYFRPKNKLYRAMRMFEDTITIDYSDNPITLEGMRKDVFRLARYIERYAEHG